eukprot:TRINITY_DN7312_c0_g2_i1.p1 TRINITY_DN7312_c0_g2~~TRINITY_DN7312_c0_g2_i1.p1  ORF type:complete len:226 (+),score=46.66 TRINITY_DN7312_c0_g2_i1:73-750(+)
MDAPVSKDEKTQALHEFPTTSSPKLKYTLNDGGTSGTCAEIAPENPADHVALPSCKLPSVLSSDLAEKDVGAKIPSLAWLDGGSQSSSPLAWLDASANVNKNSEDPMTTVAVLGLPTKVGPERMMAELKLLGFDGCYTFLNFPIDRKHGRCSFLGYGFINFMNEDIAAKFMDIFDDYRFPDINSEKVVHVSLAKVQGQPANKKRLYSSKKNNAYKVDSCGLRAPD